MDKVLDHKKTAEEVAATEASDDLAPEVEKADARAMAVDAAELNQISQYYYRREVKVAATDKNRVNRERNSSLALETADFKIKLDEILNLLQIKGEGEEGEDNNFISVKDTNSLLDIIRKHKFNILHHFIFNAWQRVNKANNCDELRTIMDEINKNELDLMPEAYTQCFNSLPPALLDSNFPLAIKFIFNCNVSNQDAWNKWHYTIMQNLGDAAASSFELAAQTKEKKATQALVQAQELVANATTVDEQHAARQAADAEALLNADTTQDLAISGLSAVQTESQQDQSPFKATDSEEISFLFVRQIFKIYMELENKPEIQLTKSSKKFIFTSWNFQYPIEKDKSFLINLSLTEAEELLIREQLRRLVNYTSKSDYLIPALDFIVALFGVIALLNKHGLNHSFAQHLQTTIRYVYLEPKQVTSNIIMLRTFVQNFHKQISDQNSHSLIPINFIKYLLNPNTSMQALGNLGLIIRELEKQPQTDRPVPRDIQALFSCLENRSKNYSDDVDVEACLKQMSTSNNWWPRLSSLLYNGKIALSPVSLLIMPFLQTCRGVFESAEALSDSSTSWVIMSEMVEFIIDYEQYFDPLSSNDVDIRETIHQLVELATTAINPLCRDPIIFGAVKKYKTNYTTDPLIKEELREKQTHLFLAMLRLHQQHKSDHNQCIKAIREFITQIPDVGPIKPPADFKYQKLKKAPLIKEPSIDLSEGLAVVFAQCDEDRMLIKFFKRLTNAPQYLTMSDRANTWLACFIRDKLIEFSCLRVIVTPTERSEYIDALLTFLKVAILAKTGFDDDINLRLKFLDKIPEEIFHSTGTLTVMYSFYQRLNFLSREMFAYDMDKDFLRIKCPDGFSPTGIINFYMVQSITNDLCATVLKIIASNKFKNFENFFKELENLFNWYYKNPQKQSFNDWINLYFMFYLNSQCKGVEPTRPFSILIKNLGYMLEGSSESRERSVSRDGKDGNRSYELFYKDGKLISSFDAILWFVDLEVSQASSVMEYAEKLSTESTNSLQPCSSIFVAYWWILNIVVEATSVYDKASDRWAFISNLVALHHDPTICSDNNIAKLIRKCFTERDDLNKSSLETLRTNKGRLETLRLDVQKRAGESIKNPWHSSAPKKPVDEFEDYLSKEPPPSFFFNRPPRWRGDQKHSQPVVEKTDAIAAKTQSP